MKRLASLVVLALICAATVVVPAGAASAIVAEEPSLWLTATRANENGSSTFITYHVATDGTLVLASFNTPNTAISSIAVDPKNRTLWGANEGSASGQPPGKLVNYDRSGNVLDEIPAGMFGGVGTEGLALTVSPDNDTLWVVDDPAGPTTAPWVYNITRNGDLISSFPTSRFDSESESPQSIAYDPYTSTLWIADNSSERIYNVDLNGELISNFLTTSQVFKELDANGVRNVQGISVESSEVLWLTARDTDRVYRVTKAGDAILSSFPITDVDGNAFDPTGVAFDRPPGDLGAAAAFGVLGLPGAKLKLKDADKWTGVAGNVGLGPDAVQDFDDGLLAGAYIVDPDGDNSNSNDVVISGGTSSADLSLAVSDAEYASLAASVLDSTQVFGEIKSTTTIVGASGLNVIEAENIELDGDETLTLVADSSSTFIVNLSVKFKLRNRSAIVLEGGLTSDNVFFNILGGAAASIEGGSVARGTIIAPDAELKIKGEGSFLVGTLIGGSEVKLEDGGRVRARSAELAAGDIGAAADATVLALPDAKVKLKDKQSTVVGDVVLGPLAEQDFSEGTIDGVLVVDPAADNTHDNDVVISGGTVVASASQAVADAVDASYAMARLQADQVFGEIKADAHIDAGSGLNVFEAKKIELDGSETLTLSGDASSQIVFNVTDRFKLKEDSSIVLTGGLLVENVVFNVLDSGDAAIESGSEVQGTILALYAGKLKVKGSGSILTGALIGGGEIIVEDAGRVAAP